MFVEDARRLLTGVEEAINRARERGKPQRLTLALRPGTGQGALAQIISTYQEQFTGPAIGVHFTYAQEEALRDGTAQVALTCQVEPLADDLSSIHVEDEVAVAVLPAGHPFAAQSSVRLADLEALPTYRAHAPLIGLETILDRVAIGLEVFVVGGSVAASLRPSLTAVRVADAPDASLRLAWRPEQEDPARDKFLAVARTVLHV